MAIDGWRAPAVAAGIGVLLAGCSTVLADVHTDAGRPTRTPRPTHATIVLADPAATRSPSPSHPPTPPPNDEPSANHSLPGGIYLDVLTAHRSTEDWAITLLDTIYMLPPDYQPPDLVDTSSAGLNGGYRVRAIVIDDLRALTDATRAAGNPLAVVSAFRGYEQQIATFDHWASLGGREEALRRSARPGHSEHQLGTALDFTSGGMAPWEADNWATSPAGAWLKAHAWRYGFVMSYPPGSFAQTGYDYEPWHYRYVGRRLAALMRKSDLSPREFLWRHQASLTGRQLADIN